MQQFKTLLNNIVQYTEQTVKELWIASHWEQKGYDPDDHQTAART